MIYKVKVSLGKDFITLDKDVISVGVKAKPENGKANQELIKKVAKFLKVGEGSIKIISGKSSRRKTIIVK